MTDLISEFIKLNICILTISSSRTLQNDKSGDVLEKKISEFGHSIFQRKIVKDNKIEIQKSIRIVMRNNIVKVFFCHSYHPCLFNHRPCRIVGNGSGFLRRRSAYMSQCKGSNYSITRS